LSTATVCPRCGTGNIAGAKFCVSCGSPLAVAVQPQVPIGPYPSVAPGFQPQPSYDYAPAMAAQQRAHDIDRTKTGLMLLIIGAFISPVPVAGIVGTILLLIGAILVIVGRKAFGPKHSRNTIWSIIIYVIGIAIGVGTALVLVFSSFFAAFNTGANPSYNPNIAAEALIGTLDGVLVGMIVGSIVGGIAYVLFTYELQKPLGRALLFSGYAMGIAIAIVEYLIIAPQINDAAQQASSSGTLDAFNSLTSQLQTLGLLSFIPAIIYGTAFYLAWSRVKRGEIPGPVS